MKYTFIIMLSSLISYHAKAQTTSPSQALATSAHRKKTRKESE